MILVYGFILTKVFFPGIRKMKFSKLKSNDLSSLREYVHRKYEWIEEFAQILTLLIYTITHWKIGKSNYYFKILSLLRWKTPNFVNRIGAVSEDEYGTLC